MKPNWLKLVPYAVIGILLFILFFKGCGKEKEIITVKVPAVSGEFELSSPTYIPSPQIEYVTRWRNREVKTENPVNDSLAKAYQKVKDSLERYKMYLDAIQIREFSNDWEDEYLSLNVSGKVQGKLLGLKPTYTIKEREVTAEVPQTALRFLGGFELGANEGLTDFPLKVNLGMQNAKGNIIRASFMRLNDQNYYLGGYDFSILNIKR